MIEKYYFEFSKIYGRLMRLELQIKNKLIHSLLMYYKEDILSVFSMFFNNKNRLQRYECKTGNAFKAILSNPQIKSSQKFKHLIGKMYLSDLLVLILQCEQFQREKITNSFYFKVPEKFGPLIKAKPFLLELRNDIAHYNFKSYEKNKSSYLEALLLFEKHLGCNIKGVNEIPTLGYKPPIKSILLSIKDLRPDLFITEENESDYFYNKDRILTDLCDDIAMHNGYDISELPSTWTILRQVFNIKKDIKSVKKSNELNLEILPLFRNFFLTTDD